MPLWEKSTYVSARWSAYSYAGEVQPHRLLRLVRSVECIFVRWRSATAQTPELVRSGGTNALHDPCGLVDH